MRHQPLVIREVTTDDVDAEARIYNRANRPWATSVEQHHHQRNHDQVPRNGIRLVAEQDGSVIGAARSNEALEGLLPQPGNFSARVAVDTQAAGQGVGRALWTKLTEWIQPQHPQQIISWADRDDRRSVAVANHWGFRRRPGTIETPDDLEDVQPWPWRFVLQLDRRDADPDSIPDPTPAPPDVEIRTLEEVVDDDDLLASLHEAHAECRADVPSWDTYQPVTKLDFEKTQRQRLAAGGFGLVAHHRHQVLAATFAERLAFVPDLHNDFTMVCRTARGQRLALALKSRLITKAAALGLERISTEVRSDNHPMLTINHTLGFRQVAMRHLLSDGPGLVQ